VASVKFTLENDNYFKIYALTKKVLLFMKARINKNC